MPSVFLFRPNAPLGPVANKNSPGKIARSSPGNHYKKNIIREICRLSLNYFFKNIKFIIDFYSLRKHPFYAFGFRQWKHSFPLEKGEICFSTPFGRRVYSKVQILVRLLSAQRLIIFVPHQRPPLDFSW